MGLGILEDNHLKHVPGTATLEQERLVASDGNLKTGPGGVVLVPQPSDDPNDPLNWPQSRKDMVCAVLCLQATFASSLTSILAANSIVLAVWFPNVDLIKIALFTGYHILGIGVAGFFFVASARVWGKRHLFLLGSIIVCASSVWSGFAGKSYGSFVAARFIQGVGLAPFEALVGAAIGDMYFVHERGVRLSIAALCLFASGFGTPVVVGKMTEALGWWWPMWGVGILTGILTPCVYFFCPETAYVRDSRLNIDTAVREYSETSSLETRRADSSNGAELSNIESFEKPKMTSDEAVLVSKVSSSSFQPPVQYQPLHPIFSKANLAIFTGRKTEISYWTLLVRPLPLFFHPGFLFACIMQASMIAWTVVIGVCMALIFLYPPLSFNETQTGYLYGGAIVGSLFGFAIAGLTIDRGSRLMTKWNNGVFEPEFRLLLAVPLVITGGIGMYGFGITAGDTGKYGWFWPDFFLAFEIAALVLSTSCGATYLVDAYRELSIEGFTCCLIFKNFICFALIYKGVGWVLELGITDLMMIMAHTQIGVCALAIPMYIYGKRIRSYYARHDIFRVYDKELYKEAWRKVARKA